MKTITIKLGYYPNSKVSGKQIGFIRSLLEKNDYGDAFDQYITKYGCRNPFKRIDSANASKLIKALIEKQKITFMDKVK
jgi:hypothetical protein